LKYHVENSHTTVHSLTVHITKLFYTLKCLLPPEENTIMMNSQNSRRSTVLFTAVIALSIISVGAILATPAAAQSSDLVAESEYDTSPDGSITVTVTAQEQGDLEISGDTTGWTITKMDPFNSFTAPSSFNSGLPYESNDENWNSGSVEPGQTWELTLEPPTDATDGDTYEFNVDHDDLNGNDIATDSFTVTVTQQEAEFEISNPIDGETLSAMTNDNVPINVTVENVGSGTGGTSAVLSIAGERFDSGGFDGLEPGETASVPLSGTAPSQAGSYEWNISATPGNTVSGTLVVEEQDDDGDTGTSSEYQVSPEGRLNLSFAAEQNNREITVSGDTTGWTIVKMKPFTQFTAPSTFQDSLPYESDDETWSSGSVSAGQNFNLTVQPPETASDGDTYDFTVTTNDLEGTQISEESVTIEVADVTYKNLPSSVDTTTAAAVDGNNDGKISLEELVLANIQRLNNSGEVAGTQVSLEELVQLNIWRLNN
jgi:hypothetical protein